MNKLCYVLRCGGGGYLHRLFLYRPSFLTVLFLIFAAFFYNGTGVSGFFSLSFGSLAQAADQVSGDQKLVLGIVLEPPHLDPTAGAAAAIDEITYANIFEGLTRIDRAGQVQPALAASWIISDDGLRYDFDLQKNVTFHDGSEFSAEDVVFSLNRARGEESTNAQKGLFDAIDQVEAVSPHRLRIVLKRKAGDLLYNLGWGDAVMVAPETASSNKSRPVGTGPFRLERWVKGDHIQLVAAADYWGEKPALTQVTFRIIPDPAASVAALLAGDIDAIANTPAPESLEIFKSDSRFSVVVGATEGETILALNHAHPALADLRVRQALAHAIDRSALIDGAMSGYGVEIGSHFSPAHPAYVDLTDQVSYDPDKARALLKEAGFADNLRLALTLPPPSYARRSGEIIAAQLRQVGVSVELIPVEWAIWLDQVFTRKAYDLTIVSHTEPTDINIYGRQDYYFNYQSPVLQKLMQDLAKETIPDQRTRLLKQAQRHIANDQVNVFLFQLAKAGVWKKNLQGLWRNSPIQANDVTGVYWTNQ